MTNKKIYPTLAGLFYFLSIAFLSAFFMSDISRQFNWCINEYGSSNGMLNFINTSEFGRIIGIILSFFFSAVLFSKKRGTLLSVAIILQLFLLMFFSFPFIGAFLLVIYTFILSLVFRKKSDKSKLTKPLMILWFIFYVVFLVFCILFVDEELYHDFILGLLFIIFYSISWIFIVLWIINPYKKITTIPETYKKTNHQFSKCFSNNSQSQQYNNSNQHNGQNQQSNVLDSSTSFNQYIKVVKPQENKTQNKPLKQCPVCLSTVSENDTSCKICGSKLE